MNKPEKGQISSEETEIILESISDGVFTVDHDWRIVLFNRAAEKITGISRQEAIGRPCWEVFRSNMCEGNCALKRTMREGKSFVSSSIYIVNSDKQRIPISASTSVLKSNRGKVLGGVEIFRDLSLVEDLRRQLNGRFKIGDLVSNSVAMRPIIDMLPQVAQSDATVLIEGETGTGKELLARIIHELSPRRDKPFVAVNCGALPDNLLESELFGYKAGAFTGANKDKPGRFALSEGGTILLDEIGDTSPAFQVRLLRVLQEHQFDPLGAVKPVRSDVRILTATNRPLSELVADGTFRRDLFYRINVVRLELPPLRDRREDIPLLVDHFIDRLNRVRDRSISGMDHKALALLMNHRFEGNIRELENIIEHAFVLCPDVVIHADHLPVELSREHSRSADHPLSGPLKSAEAKALLAALERNHYNRLATAKELGIHKSTLFRKIKKLGIVLPPGDGRSTAKSTA